MAKKGSASTPRTAFGRKEQIPSKPAPAYKNTTADDLSSAAINKIVGLDKKK